MSEKSWPDVGAAAPLAVRPAGPQLVVPGDTVNASFVKVVAIVVDVVADPVVLLVLAVLPVALVVVAVVPVVLAVVPVVLGVVLVLVVVVPATVVVVVPATVVVVVLPAQGVPWGMQTSVTVSTSVRAWTFADRTSARIVHRPGAFLLDRVWTFTPVKAPQTEPVPEPSTRTCPEWPQWPVARKVSPERSAGVHPGSDSLRQSARSKVQPWPVAVWQRVAPSGRGPFMSWMWTRHSFGPDVPAGA